MEYIVFVGNLPYSTTNESLKEFFEKAGEVTEVKIIKDRESGRSKGFGFVTFETEEAAVKAVESLNDAEFEGRKLRVDRAHQKN